MKNYSKMAVLGWYGR